MSSPAPSGSTPAPPPEPFVYPTAAHARRHGPCGYSPYPGFRPWLRDEFRFRCVYCLEREAWYPDRSASFSVDHVIPQSEDPGRVCDYDNLVYACNRCNSKRRDIRVLDPTLVAFGAHLRSEPDGRLVGLTPDGADFIDFLGLNDDPALATRRKYLSVLRIGLRLADDADARALFAEAFGFPDDMPDLRTLRPPGGNAR